MNFFRRAKPSKVVDHPKFVVTEGISGVWHYHISTPDHRSTSLCGRTTMYTSIPIEHWKMEFGQHFPKRPMWCADCESLYKK